MRIQLKLIGGLALAALPLFIGGILTIRQINQVDRNFERLARETTPAIEALIEIDSQTHRLISEAVSYALLQSIGTRGAELREEQEEMLEARERLRILLKQYRSFPRNDQRIEFARRLTAEIDFLDKSAALLLKKKPAGANQVAEFKEELEKREESVQLLLRDARRFEQSLLREKGTGARRTIGNLTAILAGAVIFLLLFLLAYGIFVNRSVARPLAKLKNAADALGDGDLNADPGIRGTDEIGVLARAFRRMAGRLNVSTVSRQYVNDIIESMDDMLIVVERNRGRIRTANRAMLKTLGYIQDDLAGRPWTFLVDALSRDEPERAIATAIDQGRQQRRLRSANGDEISVMFSAAPMREPNSQYVVCTARDITADLENETALRLARDSAQAASRTKSEFLANISHEIRTPLNAIIGSADLLAEARLPEEQHNQVVGLVTGGETLLRLIEEILDISSIEAGVLKIESRAFEFEPWFRESCGIHEAAIRARGIKYEFSSSPSIPRFVHGDPDRLRQVLTNLIGNAAKFTSEGSIAIRAETGPDSDTVHFAVSDTGIGVDESKKEIIFKAFEQADASITRRFGGTGLGLAISLRIVNRMSGRLWFNDGAESGSVFQFFVHCPSAPEAPKEENGASEDSTSPHRGGVRILLAEDNENNSNLIRAFLKETPHSLDIVENGQRAVEAIMEREYDLVLMDVQMPVMDGYGAARAIRRMEGDKKRTPLLALTAHALEEDRLRSLEAGCDDHITKPIRKNKLLAIIAKYAAH